MKQRLAFDTRQVVQPRARLAIVESCQQGIEGESVSWMSESETAERESRMLWREKERRDRRELVFGGAANCR